MNLEIALNNVKFRAFHGVFDFEKIEGNDFIVNLRVSIPWQEEIVDDLEHTISYADIYEIVEEEMSNTSDLIETVATHIRNHLLSRWEKINGGYIEIIKMNPPIKGFSGQASVKLNFF